MLLLANAVEEESPISSEMARNAKMRFADSAVWAEVAVSAAMVVMFLIEAVVLLREIELR